MMKSMIQRQTAPVFLVAVACFLFLPKVQAVNPPPDGGYAGQNTAEGTDALLSLTSGAGNVAAGFRALYHDTTGMQNTATGYRALFSNTTGSKSTAYGAQALSNNTTGTSNVATGFNTLLSNTIGNNNTGNGYRALAFNNGDGNTGMGSNALFNNRAGNQNTATGSQALFHNTAGNTNTANGSLALFSNTTGGGNTAMGGQALYSNTTGSSNTATGSLALAGNTEGNFNTANGVQALSFNTTGGSNTAVGATALLNNTEGDENTAIGSNALFYNTTGTFNTAVGYRALYFNTGSFNIALRGGSNLTTGNFNIDIGSDGVAGDAGTIRIGDGCCQSRAFIAGISGTAVSGSTVVVDANGQLGVATSSARFKEGIKPMDKASEALFALKPVTFRYKKEIDPRGILQFGLVAEHVEGVNSDLVVRDKEGKPNSVRYDAVNAMLLNEFLKEHRKNEEQEATIAQQRKDFDTIIANLKATDTRHQKQIQALTAELQKVSAQLELSKPPPRTVLNDQ